MVLLMGSNGNTINMKIKTHILSTSKARVLVADMPMDAFGIAIYDGDINWMDSNGHRIEEVPNGNWQLLGKIESITEEQWKGIVDIDYAGGYIGGSELNSKREKTAWIEVFSTASEAGLSLIESEVCLKNPHGNEKQFYYGEQGMTNEEFDKKVTQYKSAEEQVFHNPHLWYESKLKQ